MLMQPKLKILAVASVIAVLIILHQNADIAKTSSFKTINKHIKMSDMAEAGEANWRLFKRIFIIVEKFNFTHNTRQYFKNICLDENDVVFESESYNESVLKQNITLPSCKSNSGFANIHVTDSSKTVTKVELFDERRRSLTLNNKFTGCYSTEHCCCLNRGPCKSHLQMMLCIALNLYPQAKIILIGSTLLSDDRLLVYQTQRYMSIESSEDKVICPYKPGQMDNNYSGWHYTKNVIKSHHVRFDPGFGNSLMIFLKKKTVIDIGCGVGQLGYFLSKNNADINWSGFDGGDNVEELIGTNTPLREDEGHIVPKVCWVNAAAPFDLGLKYDWVIAIEVGEHIPKANEQSFLDNLVVHSIEGVILSWAVKGQGGHQHVNEQGNDYIIEQMSNRGFTFNNTISLQFRKSVTELYWLRNTLMLFHKNH